MSEALEGFRECYERTQEGGKVRYARVAFPHEGGAMEQDAVLSEAMEIVGGTHMQLIREARKQQQAKEKNEARRRELQARHG